MAAHRYWRINVTAVGSGGYVSFEEIAFVASDGAILSTGGTASASSTYPGENVSGALDANFSTIWHSGSGSLPEWYKYDFGTPVDVAAVNLRSRVSSPTQAPKDFKIQYSDNNADWTDFATITGATWAGTVPQSFPKATKQAWRINITALQGSASAGLAELQMRFSSGGADKATSAAWVFASSHYAGETGPYGAKSAIDNNSTTLWSASGAPPAHIGYQFGGSVEVVEIVLQVRNDDGAASAPKDFTIQYLDSGGTWVTARSYTGQTGWTAGESRTFSATTSASGSLSATESGSDSASLTGVVRIAGSLSATESGADVAALSGAVLITGTVAAQEAGSDTAAITGSASGAITGSLAATEVGADTADLAGVVLVRGAISAAESGADTASATGAVKVVGALSVTEAGSDVAAVTGVAVQAGMLAAVESGADTAAVTGDVLVQGSLTAAETGADTAAVAGKTLIQGALSVTESGADSATLAGKTLVQGAFAATETGNDTAAFSGDATNEWIGTLAAQETGADSASVSGVVRVTGSAVITETDADTAIVVGKVLTVGTVSASETGQDSAAVTGLLVTPTISNLIARLSVRTAVGARLDSHSAIDARPHSSPALTARHRLN